MHLLTNGASILLTLNVLHIVVRKTAVRLHTVLRSTPTQPLTPTPARELHHHLRRAVRAASARLPNSCLWLTIAPLAPALRLTSILISRFIMNLREVDYTDRNGTGADTDEGPSRLDFAERSHFANASQAATVRFVASFVDPLGTQLDYSRSDLDSVLEETLDAADGKDAPSGDRRGAAGDDDQVLADWARVDTVLQSLDQEHSAQESSASGQMSFAPRASYAR